MKNKKDRKTPSPLPKKIEEEVPAPPPEPPVIIDAQKLTFSDPTLLDTNQLLGTADGSATLFIPDDDSSVAEEEVDPMKLGILTQNAVAEGLSNLGISANGINHVYLNLHLSEFDLKDISLLHSYGHLQKVNLSYNCLGDIAALSNMKHLVELDVSHNQLEKLLDFSPPAALRVANFSHNKITSMPDLSDYKHLIKLHLDHNEILDIAGLSMCQSLSVLTLSNNHISTIEGLDDLKLKTLSLSHNKLMKIENLDSLTQLQNLDLSGNNIFSLSGFTAKHRIFRLNMAENQISELDEVEHLVQIKSLWYLDLSNNPVIDQEDYRKSVVYIMQQLKELDQKVVTVEEKVAASNLFDPPPEVQASIDHITHTVYRFLQPSKIYESTLPSIEMPYPMLVLTGPQACGKRELAHRLAQEFPDYFGLGISHTTRIPYPGEQDGKDYHFVTPDQFQSLVRQGAFIQTFKHGRCLYGLTLDAVESVAKEGLACVVHMEINGIRTLRNTYFEPRYVLIIPISTETHRERMVERGVYSHPQMEYILKHQCAVYREINQEHPGFFDMVINNNKLAEAYDRLRQLVMDYLGTTDLTSAESVDQDEPRLSTTENKDETSTHHTATSANVRRTWSRPSRQEESANTNDIASGRNRGKLEQRRTPIEEASYKRRLDAAKEAIEGYSPSVYDEIFRRPMVPMTAPGMLEGSPLAQATSMYQDPSFAAAIFPSMNNEKAEERQVQKVKGTSSDTKSRSSTSDSSSSSGEASSGLSGLSSARRFSDDESVRDGKSNKDTQDAPIENDQTLDLTALNDALESLKSRKESSRTSTPLAPRVSQEINNWLQSENGVSSGPGVNVKPILPPIPTGGR